MFNRIFLLVLDSVGIGEAKDASTFNDTGANTVGNIIKKTKVEFPNLNKLGLDNLLNDFDNKTIGYYTKAKEISNGKDTLTGHL